MNEELKFSRNLIKGRIAEVIFEQMIRNEGRYDVIPFGYEHTVPTLAQYRHLAQIKQIMENIGDAPDFVLVSADKNRGEVYLVEVKYQTIKDIEYIKKEAGELLHRWPASWIFLATPNGFYCDLSKNIIEKGEIKELPESWVERGRQEEYLRLLREFEKIN